MNRLTDADRMWRLLFQLTTLLEDGVAATLSDADLSVTEYMILSSVDREFGRCSLGLLRFSVPVPENTLTATVRALQDKGLLLTDPDHQDCALTLNGRDRTRSVQRPIRSFLAQRIGHLPDDERRLFIALATRIRETPTSNPGGLPP
ncbi:MULTISPECIES: MarR family winged helix-turn-helix transcriptional regulator [Actinoalloteichus]|uniref:MarR family transcriptional regulator n=1 Tax=Actinoalloteichus fjordicus TaxID=1612552 RepID=A0AAC9LEJ7_9PSEU|nr:MULTISPECIES: hypothetical protein [Actinoalloteichus]APU16216.1 hypothetical protein UA74_20955 [Actinoalloteichus fjordicus]APU22276.1 hypothetical protein UA75_21435 [Actinoalloteichus sp. GBA129-24]